MAKLSLKNIFNFNKPKQTLNKYNEAFFKWLGVNYTNYDYDNETYIQKGYNINPIVYSVVTQRANKVASVPFMIKKIEDKQSKSKLTNLIKSTNYNLTPQQEVKRLMFESKAYGDEFKEMPLERPNPIQTWKEFKEMYEVFMSTTGNAYIYLLSPMEGANAGRPIAWYLLPSHLTQIVIKDDHNLQGLDSPVDHYIMREGDTYTEFKESEVVHIKYGNPDYDQNGSHLYGRSPLKAVLKNIQSSNEALDLNIKTLKSGGAFGFIHGKNIPLTRDQAQDLKDRLKEMDSDSSRLGSIQGASAELGFTKVGLNTDELKPFDFLDFDTKQICNALGWSNVFLNTDARGDYGGTIQEIRKQVLCDTILPDLQLLDHAINSEILPRYKEYNGYCLEHDISELPEMQKDMKSMSEWLNPALDRGAINRKTYNAYFGFPESDDPLMEEYTVASDILTLEQAVNDFPLNDVRTNEETI